MSQSNVEAASPYGTPAGRSSLAGLMSHSFRTPVSVSSPPPDTPAAIVRLASAPSHGGSLVSNPSQPAVEAAADVSGDVAVDVFEDLTTPLLDNEEEGATETQTRGDGAEDEDAVPARDVFPSVFARDANYLGEHPASSAMGGALFLKKPTSVALSSAASMVEPADPNSSKSSFRDQGVAIVYGLINSVVTIPMLLSFASIIFQHQLYQAVFGQLVKLVFLSCALHQLCFVCFSTIPFAVGQVQDVGLIFLSAMASSIAVAAPAAGYTFRETVSTALLTLTCSTAIVGVLIILTGYLKLAQLVQYCPLPVVGGYLGFVGYFCTAAGVSLATGDHVASLASWWALIRSPTALLYLAPALGTTLLLYLGTRYLRHPLALPALLCAIPLTFYAVLAVTGYTLADAQEGGWAKKQSDEEVHEFWRVWDLYNVKEFPNGICWSAIPGQLGLLTALFFVVAFGSSMDVAAIQQNCPTPLDYNKELVTVGISNFVTGLAGCGFTGSYIFSQTLFSQRMGIRSRFNGIVIVISELLLFALPFSIIQYFPNFFFAGLMMWIGLDILKDWLVLSIRRVRPVEFLLLWATFLLICVFGLELGIMMGIVLACMLFSYSYARVHVHAFNVLPSRSGSVRTFEERTVLGVLNKRITAVSLSGYIFFGSSIKISDKLKQLATLLLQSDEQITKFRVTGQLNSSWDNLALELSQLDKLPMVVAALNKNAVHKAYAAFAAAPRYVLLDFRRVNGLDATAAQTFSTLARTLAAMHIELIITHVPLQRTEIKRLLQGHGIIPLDEDGQTDSCTSSGICRYFPSMDEGLSFCEEELLSHARLYGLLPPAVRRMDLAQVLRANIEQPQLLIPGAHDYSKLAADLQPYLQTRHYNEQDVIFDVGDPSDTVFLLHEGIIACQMVYSGVRLRQPHHVPDSKEGWQREQRYRVFKFGAGGLLGEMDFYMQRPRSFVAVACSSIEVSCLQRSSYEAMSRVSPKLLNVLQAIILRSACTSLSHTVDVLENADLE